MSLKKFPVTIHYDGDNVITKLLNLGEYSWVNPHINDSEFAYGLIGSINLTGYLLHFDKDVSNTEAMRLIHEKELRPASIAEGLAFGAQHKAVQIQFPIVCLGQFRTTEKGEVYALVLDTTNNEHRAYLDWAGGKWKPWCRFLCFS